MNEIQEGRDKGTGSPTHRYVCITLPRDGASLSMVLIGKWKICLYAKANWVLLAGIMCPAVGGGAPELGMPSPPLIPGGALSSSRKSREYSRQM